MLTNRKSTRHVLRHIATALCATSALAFGAGPAFAAVPGADLYIGVGLGQSNADLSAADLGELEFDRKDMGWKLFAGGRFLSFIGAEISYMDFGKPSGGNSEVDYKGLAGFGMLYAPIPLPVLDLYLKAGLARLDVDAAATVGDFNTKDTKFAYGAGLQLKFGSFAIRGEYEQFKVEGAKPSMLSLGFSKSFL
jgi:opacity protein-like surface antigen